jgi:hypothetical protein
MIALLWLLLSTRASPFKSKCQLEAENVALRHQVIVLRRQVRSRVRLTNLDRLVLVQLYRWFPSILRVLAIVQPETVVRWHRAGFRSYWRWKSRSQGGRPSIGADLCALIRQMSVDNRAAPDANAWITTGRKSCVVQTPQRALVGPSARGHLPHRDPK